MLEQIVRPFQVRQVHTTRRITKSASVPGDDTATLTWGTAGNVPAGVLQFTDTPVDLTVVGFNTRTSAEDWQMSGTPTTETVDIKNSGGDVVGQAKRVREIKFKRRDVAPVDSRTTKPATTNSGVSDTVTGASQSISANRSVERSDSMTWDE